MAYTYQVSFYIGPEQMSELQIGEAVERALSYLRALLPSEPGFVTARALFSVDTPERVHLLFQSQWQRWSDLVCHRESHRAEEKLLREFQPHITLQDLEVGAFAEVS